ncbi:MAG: plasmid pRiA4b ORF-3 family protein, partial [Planctomycetaceae bacterium]|nr:plasmid pRiA4b ORF-3 family protein [Planctomycetaceae bacterium]
STDARAGDHLIFRVIDGEERWYTLTFEARADRNEAVIKERNLAIIGLGQKMMKRPYGAMEWEITTKALATGLYQQDVPPDPFGELWPHMMKGMDDEQGYILPEPEPDPLLSALFEHPAQVYDPEAPPSLPREYDPEYGRRHARQSLKARKGSVKSWTFRVNHRAAPDVWGDIELAEDQTLEDLHLQIQVSFGWNDDHLYSFF